MSSVSLCLSAECESCLAEADTCSFNSREENVQSGVDRDITLEIFESQMHHLLKPDLRVSGDGTRPGMLTMKSTFYSVRINDCQCQVINATIKDLLIETSRTVIKRSLIVALMT